MTFSHLRSIIIRIRPFTPIIHSFFHILNFFFTYNLSTLFSPILHILNSSCSYPRFQKNSKIKIHSQMLAFDWIMNPILQRQLPKQTQYVLVFQIFISGSSFILNFAQFVFKPFVSLIMKIRLICPYVSNRTAVVYKVSLIVDFFAFVKDYLLFTSMHHSFVSLEYLLNHTTKIFK